jgi:signal transduction histidine kinase
LSGTEKGSSARDYLAEIPSPSFRLWAGLCVILSVFIIFAVYSIHQIRWLEAFQINVVQRNFKASVELLRLENDANSLGITLRDMTQPKTEYPLSDWQPMLGRLHEDMANAVNLEARYAAATPATRSQIEELQGEVAGFWRTADRAFAQIQNSNVASARNLIQTTLETQDAVITGTVASLIRLNEQSQVDAAHQIRRVYGNFETDNLLLLGVLLLLAVATGLYTLQANRKTFDRLRHLAATLQSQSEELRKLSWKLIDVQEATLRQVAHDLHDEFGQILTAVGILLSRAGQKTASKDDIQYVKDIVEETLQNVRDRSQMFRPAILDDFGLSKTLEWFVEQFSRQTGIQVRIEGEAEGSPMPAEEAVHIYRIVQEALSNVARHSGATRAVVKLKEENGELRVEIRDEGRGFVLDSRRNQAAGEGFGLLGMRERARRLDGTLTIRSSPAQGTVVSVRVPVRQLQNT